MERFAFNLSEDVRSSLYKICRLCGIETSEKITIAEEIICFDDNSVNDDEPSLCGKIFRCIGIQVEGSDNMPQSICRLCFDKINDFFEFREMCLSTDQQTRKLLRVAEREKYNVEKGTQTENILSLKPIKRRKNVQSPSSSTLSQPKAKKLKIGPELHKSVDDADVQKKAGKPKKSFKVEKDSTSKHTNKITKGGKIVEPSTECLETSKQTKTEDDTTPPISADLSKAIKEEKLAADLNINKNINSDQMEEVAEKIPKLGGGKSVIKKKRRRFVKRLTYVKNKKKKRALATTMDTDISVLQETAPEEMLENPNPNVDGSVEPINENIDGEKERCTICLKPFLPDDLEMHMQTLHIPRVVRYYCVYCNEIISDKVEIKSHNLWHKLSKTPFKCGRCNKLVDTLIGYTKHIHECSNYRPLTIIPDINCEKCNEQFATQNLYYWHSCIIESRLCPKCNKKIAKKNNMLGHVINCLGVIQKKVKTEKDAAGTKSSGHVKENKLLTKKIAEKSKVMPDDVSTDIKNEEENELLEITENRFDSIDLPEVINRSKEVTVAIEEVLKDEFEFVNIKEEPLEESDHSELEMESDPEVLHLPVISEIKVKEEIINPEYDEEGIADEVILKQITTADVSEGNEMDVVDDRDTTKPTIKLKIKKHHGRLNSSIVCESNSSAEDSPAKKKRRNINQLRSKSHDETTKEIVEGEEPNGNSRKSIGKERLDPNLKSQCNRISSDNIPIISGIDVDKQRSQSVSNIENDINNSIIEAAEPRPENSTLPVIASVSSGVENVQIANVILPPQNTENISNTTFAMPQIAKVSGGVNISNDIEFVQVKTEYDNEEFYDNITTTIDKQTDECEIENMNFVNVNSDQSAAATENISNIERNIKYGNTEKTDNDGGNDLAGFAFKKIKLKLPVEETSTADSKKSENLQQKNLKVIRRPRKKRMVANVCNSLPVRSNTRPRRNICKNIVKKDEELLKSEANNDICSNKSNLAVTEEQQECNHAGNDTINATEISDLNQVEKIIKKPVTKNIATTKRNKLAPVKSEKLAKNKKKEDVIKEGEQSSDFEDMDDLPLGAIPKPSNISESLKLESSSRLANLKTETHSEKSNLKTKNETELLNESQANESRPGKILSEKKQFNKIKNKNNYGGKKPSEIISESSEDSSSSSDSTNDDSDSSSDHSDTFDDTTSSSESFSQAFGDDTSDLSSESDGKNSLPIITKKQNKNPEKPPLIINQITTQIKRKPVTTSTPKLNFISARKSGRGGRRSIKKSILSKKLATPNIFIRSAPNASGGNKKEETILNILCKKSKQNKLIKTDKKDDCSIDVSHVQALGNFATQFNFSENVPSGGIFSAQKLQRLSEDDSMESNNKDSIKDCSDLINEIEEEQKQNDHIKNEQKNDKDQNSEEQDKINDFNNQNTLNLDLNPQNDNKPNNFSKSPDKDIKNSCEVIEKETPQSTTTADDKIDLESKSLAEESQHSTPQKSLESTQCNSNNKTTISTLELLDDNITLSKSVYSGFDTIITNKPENFPAVTITPIDESTSCETTLPKTIPEDLTIIKKPTTELIEDETETVSQKSNFKIDSQLEKSPNKSFDDDDNKDSIFGKKVLGDLRKKEKFPLFKPQHSRFSKDTEKKFSMFDRGYSVLSTCKQEPPRPPSHSSHNLAIKHQNIQEKECSNFKNDMKYRHKIFSKPSLYAKEINQIDLKTTEPHENYATATTTIDPTNQISFKDNLETICIDTTSSSNSNVPEILKSISSHSFGKDLCLSIESSDQDSSSMPKKFDNNITSSSDNLSGINLSEVSIMPRYLQKLDITSYGGETYNKNITDNQTDITTTTSSLFLPSGSNNLTQLPETTLQISSNTSRLLSGSNIDKTTSTYVPNFLLANPEISILPFTTSSPLENINIIAENHNNANLEKQLHKIMDLEDISSESNLDSEDLIIQEETALNASSHSFNWSTQKTANRFLPGD